MQAAAGSTGKILSVTPVRPSVRPSVSFTTRKPECRIKRVGDLVRRPGYHLRCMYVSLSFRVPSEALIGAVYGRVKQVQSSPRSPTSLRTGPRPLPPLPFLPSFRFVSEGGVDAW